ncbi:RNA-directed DNA methylation 4, partial [Sorghum bicolor]|uniref:RNA-directed DNA methylation 4 n=1 Tax=Sorghum bicolor TaxID=4558 RepID=UPI000B423AB6
MMRSIQQNHDKGIELDIISLAQSEDSEVYDIYTVKEVDDTNMEATSAALYPRLQVDDGEDECYDDDYPCDRDDSNAEDNPLFDYPDELSEDEDDGSNDEDILEMKKVLALRHCLDTPKNPKLYNIPHHIESYG